MRTHLWTERVILRARNRQTNRRTLHSASSSDTSRRGPSTWSSWILAASYHACMDHADPRSQFPASTFSCVSYSPLIFWFLSHRRFSISTHFSRNVVSQSFRNFRFVPERLAQKIRAERPSNGYPSQGPTEPPLHRNSALLVEAHWSVAFSCRGTTLDFGPRPLCVLESCLLLSRTATHGQSPSAGVDVPSLTYSLCWRSHLRREALRQRRCLPNSLS